MCCVVKDSQSKRLVKSILYCKYTTNTQYYGPCFQRYFASYLTINNKNVRVRTCVTVSCTKHKYLNPTWQENDRQKRFFFLLLSWVFDYNSNIFYVSHIPFSTRYMPLWNNGLQRIVVFWQSDLPKRRVLDSFRGHTLSMTAIFWPFLTPSPPSDCKMTSFLLNRMTSLLLILTANHQPPLPLGCGRT